MITNVTVWNEYRYERQSKEVAKVYPEGIHGAIAKALESDLEIVVKTSTLDEPEHGMNEEVLNNTDVLIWWGHKAHDEVKNDIVDKIYNRVLCGMGLIVLHSAHMSKIFIKLMGTSCTLKWREIGEKERLWVIEPSHPIAEGVGEYVELEHEEMYGERFDIPAPNTLVFAGWFQGGELFRSGCCFNRGYGKIFYFQPGHETYPIYYNHEIQRIIRNAVKWAKPVKTIIKLECPKTAPLENIQSI
jgi:trehalose utilization protein